MTTPVQGAPTTSSVLSRRRRWLVLVVCAFALFLVGLDTTIVTVGLAEIGRGLAIEPGRLAWVVDAYTVPFASLLITSGALADRFGRRRVFQIGLVVFGLSSLACALAPTFGALIAARAVQGVGASMLTPVALSIVVTAMPDPRERAQAIGVWGAMFGISMAVGPVTGGALLAVLDWPALFWINAPVVLVVLVLTALLVPESRAASRRRVDAPGQLLLILVLVLGVGILVEAPRIGWASAPALLGAGALAVALVAFVVLESRRREPLLEPSLFRVPSFVASIVGAIAVFVAFSMTLLLTTLLLQEGEGWSALSAGAATLPMAIAAVICAPISGFLVGRAGARIPMLIAGTSLTAGGALLAGLLAVAGAPVLLAAYLLIGAGVGFANAPITNTAVDGLERSRAGVASGTASTARQVGTAIGAALAGALAAGAGVSTGVGADAGTGAGSGAAAMGDLAMRLMPGWAIIAACGLILLLCASAAPRRARAKRGADGRP